MTTLAWLVAVVVLLMLAPTLLRLGFKLAAATVLRGYLVRVGAEALAKQPDTIRLGAATLDWQDPVSIDAQRFALRRLGFSAAGEFRIDALPDVTLALFTHVERGAVAAVYEHKVAGVFTDLVAFVADGSVTVTSGPENGMPQRAEHPKQHLPGANPEQLAERLAAAVGHRECRRVTNEEVVSAFEHAYADDIAWRKKRGLTAAEVARAALADMDRKKQP